MQTALCVLLLTWGAFAAPQKPEAARSYEGDQTELNSAAQSTKVLLAKVSDFMNRITELTRNSQKLTNAEAMTLLPEFVVEAVRLRDALEDSPVKSEDSEAVQRVKEMITNSLHAFAQRYDDLGATTTQEPELLVDNTEAAVDVITDEPQPEPTTVLLPSEDETNEDEAEIEFVETENEIVEVAPAPKPLPAINRPYVPVNSPFSNSQAFRFSNPIRHHVQGPAPIIKLLPSGGYYVYYNQGR
ncbi:uncharacterized protein [Palaemon carinicauda]|uniref:uncharacterized protein n=1 Tax=Palaemon carinicauda TaxID=392227 RepID=UPI0035B633D9